MTGKASQRPHLPCLDASRQFLDNFYFQECPFTDALPSEKVHGQKLSKKHLPCLDAPRQFLDNFYCPRSKSVLLDGS